MEDRHAKHILQKSATKIWFEINIILACLFVCLLFAPFFMPIFHSLSFERNTKLSVNRRNYTNLNFHIFTIFVSINYEELRIGSSTSVSYRNKNRAEKNIGKTMIQRQHFSGSSDFDIKRLTWLIYYDRRRKEKSIRSKKRYINSYLSRFQKDEDIINLMSVKVFEILLILKLNKKRK